jgi:hypothetical protein
MSKGLPASEAHLNKTSIALVEGLQVPLKSILFGDLVLGANVRPTRLASGHTESLAAQNDVEIHTVDARAGVILDTEINVLLNAEAKVSCKESGRGRI